MQSLKSRALRHRALIAGLALVSAVTTACGGSASASHPSRASTAPSAQSPAAQATSAAPAFPVTIGSGADAVTIKAQPKAIVSLSPSATEMLYAIGAGTQVKAVDKYSDYPPEAPRTDLTGLQPNVEAIIADQPDLVVISNDSGDFRKRLASLSVPVLLLPAAAKVDDVYAQLDELGQATGHLAQAQQEAADIKTQVTKIDASVPHRSTPLTYFYELEPDYYSVTSDTFVGQLLGTLGLKSIADSAHGAAAAGGYPQLSAEFILKANPDYILLADTKCCHQSHATVAKRPGWSKVAAVAHGHVVALDDDIASRWGPRIVDLLRTVADALKS